MIWILAYSNMLPIFRQEILIFLLDTIWYLKFLKETLKKSRTGSGFSLKQFRTIRMKNLKISIRKKDNELTHKIWCLVVL